MRYTKSIHSMTVNKACVDLLVPFPQHLSHWTPYCSYLVNIVASLHPEPILRNASIHSHAPGC